MTDEYNSIGNEEKSVDHGFLNRHKKLFIIVFSIWFTFVLLLWLFNGTYENLLVAISVIICGLSLLVFWVIRSKVLNLVENWKMNPKTKFILIGSLGAVYVETVFWFIEKLGGYEGIAAHPNLLIDLALTMPWYIAMVALLWKVETKKKYTYLEILILGGIYDFFADGIVGSLLAGSFSPLLLILLVIVYPIFVVTYSFIVLPASFLVEKEADSIRHETETVSTKNKWILGLYPILGLSILIVVFFIAILIIANIILGIIILVICIFLGIYIYKKKSKKKD